MVYSSVYYGIYYSIGFGVNPTPLHLHLKTETARYSEVRPGSKFIILRSLCKGSMVGIPINLTKAPSFYLRGLSLYDLATWTNGPTLRSKYTPGIYRDVENKMESTIYSGYI